MEKTAPTLEKYVNSTIETLSETISQAVDHSPLDENAVLQFKEAVHLAAPGYHTVENGYALISDGSVAVSVLTDMPRVTPAMWDWWFGWHGDSSDKYKLWHPPAHISAEWGDKQIGTVGYIGRDSHIQEYIGPKKERAIIQFKDPSILGLPRFDPNSSDAVYIVARIGLEEAPIDFGWLIHQVRETPTGSEMRSRFWLGGPHIEGRNWAANLLVPIIRRVRKIDEAQVTDLLIHCAEEMHHLAKFLPDLYAEYQ